MLLVIENIFNKTKQNKLKHIHINCSCVRLFSLLFFLLNRWISNLAHPSGSNCKHQLYHANIFALGQQL